MFLSNCAQQPTLRSKPDLSTLPSTQTTEYDTINPEERETSTAKLEPVIYQFGYGKYNRLRQKLTDEIYQQGLELFFALHSGELLAPQPSAFSIDPTSTTDTDLIWSERVVDRLFKLQLPNELNQFAQVIDIETVSVTPRDTEIIGLSTYHAYPHYHNKLGSGGFIDTSNGNKLGLMYASQAAVIVGEQIKLRQNYAYFLTIPSPGWHWLQLTEITPGYTQVSLYNGSIESIEYSIIVENTLRF